MPNYSMKLGSTGVYYFICVFSFFILREIRMGSLSSGETNISLPSSNSSTNTTKFIVTPKLPHGFSPPAAKSVLRCHLKTSARTSPRHSGSCQALQLLAVAGPDPSSRGEKCVYDIGFTQGVHGMDTFYNADGSVIQGFVIGCCTHNTQPPCLRR